MLGGPGTELARPWILTCDDDRPRGATGRVGHARDRLRGARAQARSTTPRVVGRRAYDGAVNAATYPGCHIYWARLDELHPRHLPLLDDLELGRRKAYRREEDRARFTLAAVMLRLVVAAHSGVAPACAVVDRTCADCGKPHGRPRLPSGGLDLSVTHSGDFAAVATSTAGPVGIDLEAVRPFDHEALVNEVLALEERDEATSVKAFFTYWTRKESVLKATGAGLSIPMRALTVTPPAQPPRLLCYPSVPALQARMIDISPARDYPGAATVLSDEPVAFHPQDGSALLRAYR